MPNPVWRSQSDILTNDHILQQALKAKNEICCVLLRNLRMKGVSVEIMESRVSAIHLQRDWFT